MPEPMEMLVTVAVAIGLGFGAGIIGKVAPRRRSGNGAAALKAHIAADELTFKRIEARLKQGDGQFKKVHGRLERLEKISTGGMAMMAERDPTRQLVARTLLGSEDYEENVAPLVRALREAREEREARQHRGRHGR